MFCSLADLVEHFKKTGIEELSGTYVYLRQVNLSVHSEGMQMQPRPWGVVGGAMTLGGQFEGCRRRDAWLTEGSCVPCCESPGQVVGAGGPPASLSSSGTACGCSSCH